MMRIVKSARSLVLAAAVCAGSAMASGVFPIATNPAVIEFSGKAAFDGTNYLASLVAGANVAGQMVSSNGVLVGAPVVVGANPGFPPDVAMASTKTNSLAAWTDYSQSPGVMIFGRLISASGLGTTFPLLPALGGHGPQAIQAAASDGSNFLAVWRDTSTGVHYGQLISGSGTLIGSEFPIFTMAGNGDRNIALSYGLTNYLITWQDGTGGGDNTYCKLISPAGVVGSAFQINTTASLDMNPATIGFDGTNYLVVWNRSTNYNSSGWPDWMLCGRFVSQFGVALGSEQVLVSEQASFPALGFDGANYLLAWGFDTTTTNSDQTIHAQFLNPTGSPLGPIFTPFSMQGTNPPLLPLDGVLFDGKRFLLTATFGSFIVGPTGDVMGFNGGDVYGRFLARSTAAPVFTNATVTGGYFQGQLVLTPGMNYTIEVSTNLQDWLPVGLVSSDGTNKLDLQDDRGVAGESRMFYRATVGNLLPLTFSINFHEYANAGSFNGDSTPAVSYPVTLNSYSANFDVQNDSGLPLATNVFFTGPAGCGLTNTPADPNNSFIDFSSASYQSPFISNPSAAPGGTWVVNFRGTNQTFNVADPMATSRLTIPLPTVSVSGDVLQSVSWTYMDASTGSTLGTAPVYMTDLQVQIEGLVGGRIYDSPWLTPNVTSHTLTSTVNWSNVSTINMAYDDSLGNHYVVFFIKP